jgi:hypothetical protein
MLRKLVICFVGAFCLFNSRSAILAEDIVGFKSVAAELAMPFLGRGIGNGFFSPAFPYVDCSCYGRNDSNDKNGKHND